MDSANWSGSYFKAIVGRWWTWILAAATVLGGIAALYYFYKETGVEPLVVCLGALLFASLLLNLRQAFVWRDENAAKVTAEHRAETAERAAKEAEDRADEAERAAQARSQEKANARAHDDAYYPDDAEERGFTWEADYWDQGQPPTRHYGRATVSPLRAIQPALLEAELSQPPGEYWFELHSCPAGEKLRTGPKTMMSMRGVQDGTSNAIRVEGTTLKIFEKEIALTQDRRLIIQAVAPRPFQFTRIRRRKGPLADPPPSTAAAQSQPSSPESSGSTGAS